MLLTHSSAAGSVAKAGLRVERVHRKPRLGTMVASDPKDAGVQNPPQTILLLYHTILYHNVIFLPRLELWLTLLTRDSTVASVGFLSPGLDLRARSLKIPARLWAF